MLKPVETHFEKQTYLWFCFLPSFSFKALPVRGNNNMSMFMNSGFKLSHCLEMRWNCSQDGPYTFHFSQDNDYVITVVSHSYHQYVYGRKRFSKLWYLFMCLRSIFLLLPMNSKWSLVSLLSVFPFGTFPSLPCTLLETKSGSCCLLNNTWMKKWWRPWTPESDSEPKL